MSDNEFRFVLSCDINIPVTFRVERLEGTLPSIKYPNSEERKAELYVECALYIDGAPFGLPTKTRLESAGPLYCWNELITLSTKYRDLTAHSQLALTESGANFLLPSPIASSNELVIVWDPEVGKINPSELKKLKLARSLTCGIIDRDLKPSSNERKSIQRILKYPPTRALSGDERQLLWKFRFSLMSEKMALTKFLRCVEWSDVQKDVRESLGSNGKVAPL